MARADGAFAFGKSGHTWSSGSAFNYATPEEASKWAMTLCRSRKEAPDACKIIATNPTTTGEATALHIADGMRSVAPELAVTRLARGLPVGADLEYADELTLGRAFAGRRAV